MASVLVYDFTQYNIVTDETVHSARPATLEAIAKIDNAIVLEETAQEVETSQVDGDGFYHAEDIRGTEGGVEKNGDGKGISVGESALQRGRNWVRQIFEHTKIAYTHSVNVERIFPWTGGNTFEESLEEQIPDAFLTYYLSFQVDGTIDYIPFQRFDLADCSNPQNTQSRRTLEHRIQDKFRSLTKEI